MRVGVYGGSFNPPHVGHALVATWARLSGRVDEVWFVPAFVHPFDKALAPWELRLRMCRALASELGDWARCDDVEARLGGTSYTVRTLDALREAAPDAELRLIVGADILPQTPTWREWSRIEKMYAPIVVGRDGYAPVADAPTFPAISSTEIRRRRASGEPVEHLLSRGVRAIYEAG